MKYLMTLSLAAAIIVGCSSNDQSNENSLRLRSDQEVSSEMIGTIDSLEKELRAEDFKTDSEASSILMDSYLKYVSLFPGNEEKCPEYLYKAAAIARAVNLPVKAIKHYTEILTDYPSYKNASEAAFQIAFTYDNDLNEPERAKEAYQSVIEKYPGDLWAEQSAERLKTIDMSEDELIKMLMEKNNLN